MSEDTHAVETDPDPADDASSDEPLDAEEDRRDALRELLSRDSAVDWQGIKADKSDQKPRRPAAKAPKQRQPKPPKTTKKRMTRSGRLARIKAHGFDGDSEEDRDDIKEALVGAWTDARKQMETARTSRLEHLRVTREAKDSDQGEAVAEPEASVPEAPPPKKEPASLPPRAAARSPDIPRAARPRPLQLPATPAPYSTGALAGRLKWVIAVLVVGLIYLGVTGRMAKTEFEEALAKARADQGAVLGGIQTGREQAETRANEALAKVEKLKAEKTELITSRAELAQRRQELDRKVETLEHDLQLARDSLSNSSRTALEVRTQEARKAAAWSKVRAQLEADLATERANVQAERKAGSEAKAKADARERQLELAIADSEGEVRQAELTLAEANKERDRLKGVASSLSRELEEARKARDALQTQLSEMKSATEEVRVGLTAQQLAPDGSTRPAAKPVVQNAGPSGTRANVPLSAAARAQLQRAAKGEVLLAVRVGLEAAPPFTISLSAGDVNLGEPLVTGSQLRFWIGAAHAKAVLAQDPLVLIVGSEGAGDRLAAAQVDAVELVAFPLSPDVRARLEHLGQR